MAWLNWNYLDDLYVLSKYSSKSDKLNELPPEKLYPPDIWRVGMKHPFISAILKGGLPEVISSLEQLRAVTQVLEELNALLRSRIARSAQRPTKQYRETLADWGRRYSLFEAGESTCHDDCFGVSVGSRYFIINVPSYQLFFASVNGQMRIVMAAPYVD